MQKAKGKLEWKDGEIQLKANPKVALSILENGANEEQDELQEMWAGLFATSLSPDGKDDENLIYIHVLSQLTVAESRFFKYMCDNSKKSISKTGVVAAQMFTMVGKKIEEITGIVDPNSQENILIHLNSLRLSDGRDQLFPSGFKSRDWKGDVLAWVCPTNFALQLYLKCIGFKGKAEEYWKLEIPK